MVIQVVRGSHRTHQWSPQCPVRTHRMDTTQLPSVLWNIYTQDPESVMQKGHTLLPGVRAWMQANPDWENCPVWFEINTEECLKQMEITWVDDTDFITGGIAPEGYLPPE